MDPYILFHTLVNFVDAEDSTKEESRTYDLKLEIMDATSQMASQNLSPKTYDKYAEDQFTQKIDPNNKVKPQLRKHSNYCHTSNPSISIC